MRQRVRVVCCTAAVAAMTACGSQSPSNSPSPPSVFPLTITRDGGVAGFPDDLVTMVLSPAGGPVRVEDPQIGAAGPVFNELVNDLNGGRSASSMCTPV